MNIPLLYNNRKNLIPNLTVGTTTALVTTPEGLAWAFLTGVNPVRGLSGLMVGDALGGCIGTEQ